MKIYTKKGDAGKTSLFGGARVSKDDIRIEAYGTVDELNSFVGLLSNSLKEKEYTQLCDKIQNHLFDIGACLAVDPEKSLPVPSLKEDDILFLEKTIDDMESDLPLLRNFILPGGSIASSYAHVTRTVCRRAERRVVSLDHRAIVDPLIVKYLNRLSDLLFVWARKINHEAGLPEKTWNS